LFDRDLLALSGTPGKPVGLGSVQRVSPRHAVEPHTPSLAVICKTGRVLAETAHTAWRHVAHCAGTARRRLDRELWWRAASTGVYPPGRLTPSALPRNQGRHATGNTGMPGSI